MKSSSISVGIYLRNEKIFEFLGSLIISVWHQALLAVKASTNFMRLTNAVRCVSRAETMQHSKHTGDMLGQAFV